MKSVLLLCHRLPWPPDKGDKIRSYHVLRRLARDYRVYLGTFVDDPPDWQHVAAVRGICAGTCIRPLKPWRVRWRALAALARGEAVTVGCYRDPVLQRWVDQLVGAHTIDLVVCCSSGVAPLVMGHGGLPRVMDFVDADSDKWRQYARGRRGLAHWLYLREAGRLADAERAIAMQFDAGIFVSAAEAAFFIGRAPESACRIHGIANGVDADYWDPGLDYRDPYADGGPVVLFVGAMDYRANVQAVQWFVAKVWSRIARQRAGARFYIVGSHPAREVRRLGQVAGVTVTGKVDDVRPYLAHAHAVTAPLRIARGIQNKVLEALAMEKVVLATPEAWEGIADFGGREGCISGSPEVMAAEALRWLDTRQPARVPAARAMVSSHHDWARNLDAYVDVLHEVAGDRQVAPRGDALIGEACS